MSQFPSPGGGSPGSGSFPGAGGGFPMSRPAGAFPTSGGFLAGGGLGLPTSGNGWPAGPGGGGFPGGPVGGGWPGGGFGAAPPPPKPSGQKRLLVGLLVAVGVGVVVLAVVVAMMGFGSSSSTTATRAPETTLVTRGTPVRTPSTIGPTPTPSPSTPTRTPTTPRPSPTPTPPPTSGLPSPTVRDGADPGLYGPPMTDSALYQLGAVGIDCGPVARYTTWAEVQAAWERDLACYHARWQQVAGDLPPLQLQFFTGSIETPCGKIDWYGVFCGQGEHRAIYIGDSIVDWATRYAAWHWMTITHEYAHYLQHAYGILDTRKFVVEAPQPTQRRVELQASCIATQQARGMVGGAFGRPQLDEVLTMYAGDPTHGTTEHLKQWALVGWSAHTIADCNTWIVPADDVT